MGKSTYSMGGGGHYKRMCVYDGEGGHIFASILDG